MSSKAKQDKKDKRKRFAVYSTERIEQILRSQTEGYEPDMTPFFENDIEFRDANVPFQMTEWEQDEWLKCSADPEYFIGNYVKFQTDRGWQTVDLRPYQKDFIHLVCDEHWSDEYQTFVPENRHVISCMARQSGKCSSGSTEVGVIAESGFGRHRRARRLPLAEIYYACGGCESPIDTLIRKLRSVAYGYRLRKDGLYRRMMRLVHRLECRRFRGYGEGKIIGTITFDEEQMITVEGEGGKAMTVEEIHRTRPFEVYRLVLANGMSIDCADTHMVMSTKGWRFVRDLCPGDMVTTKFGDSEVIGVEDLGFKEFMFDLSIAEEEHSYLTNDILSHNTTTIAAAFTWYVTFHTERNLFITANKGQTTLEIVNKLTEMVKGLPFWLKPGIVKKNQSQLKFDNGCFVYSAPASKSPATGFTVHFMYIDEAALIPANIIDDYWKSVYPTLSSSKVARIVLTSTPRGRQNQFYRLWEGSELGTNSFKNLKVEWWQNPAHDDAWAEEERRNFGEEEFAQEYELQWDVAASKLVRGTDNQFMNRIRREFVNVDIPQMPKELSDCFLWHPDFDPTATAANSKYNFVLIGDTAEGKVIQVAGKNTPDYNILQIFRMELMPIHRIRRNVFDKEVTIADCVRFRQVGVYIDNFHDEGQMGTAAKYLTFNVFKSGQTVSGKSVDNVRILIEMNFNGKNFLKTLADHKYWYDDIVFRTVHNSSDPLKYQKKKPGFKTTSGGKGIGKAYFCESGARMLTCRRIIISHYNKEPNLCTIAQLGAFDKIRKSQSSDYFVYGGVGLHDDLAYSVLNCSRVVEIPEFSEWMLDWFESNDMEGKGNADNYRKVAEMLATAVNDDDDGMSDSEFSALYTGNNAAPQRWGGMGFGAAPTYGSLMGGGHGLCSPQRTYGSVMGGTMTNPYLNRR